MIIEAFKRCELNKVWGLIEGEWVHIKEEYLAHHKPQVGHEIQDHPAAPIAVDPAKEPAAPAETPVPAPTAETLVPAEVPAATPTN